MTKDEYLEGLKLALPFLGNSIGSLYDVIKQLDAPGVAMRPIEAAVVVELVRQNTNLIELLKAGLGKIDE